MERVKQLLQSGIVTVNCGMSNGGEARVNLWTNEGSRPIGTFALPILTKARNQRWYDVLELQKFWTAPRPELDGKALISLLEGKAGFGLSYWGADVIALSAGNEPLAAINYETAEADKDTRKYIEGIDPAWWHRNLGGAAQAAYQPLGQLHFLRKALSKQTWASIAKVVPVSDYLFFLLMGVGWHDCRMLQSQGLLAKESRLLVRASSELPGTYTVCPWINADCTTGARHPADAFVIPFSHDSVDARKIGFSATPLVVWTGTWLGVASVSNIGPCEQTRIGGLSFEGIDPPTLQKNTGKFGPVYDYLRKRAGLTHEQVGSLAIGDVGSMLPLDAGKFSGLSAEDAANYVIGELRGMATTPTNGLITVLHAAAKAVVEDLHRITDLTRKPMEKVAIVGGWSQNLHFRNLLGKIGGFEVVIPPHATNATDAGTATEVLTRAINSDGGSVTFNEVLQTLPVT